MSKKWIELTGKLIDLTESGNLDWNETSKSNLVQTVVSGMVIQIESDDLFTKDYIITIRDRDNNVIDTFSDIILSEMSGDEWYPKLHDMWNTIRRQISGADSLIDELLMKLDEKDIIPF